LSDGGDGCHHEWVFAFASDFINNFGWPRRKKVLRVPSFFNSFGSICESFAGNMSIAGMIFDADHHQQHQAAVAVTCPSHFPSFCAAGQSNVATANSKSHIKASSESARA